MPFPMALHKENRVYFFDGYDTWQDLEECDLRKLDPEGSSEIAFQYASPTAEYVFHLPFRRAERFLSTAQLRALPRTPAKDQEKAIFQDSVIDETESLKHPAQEILQALDVDVASVCPHGLRDKQAYLAQSAIRDLLWPTSGRDASAWAEEPWDGLCLPPDLR
jgi:hypothetical protein